MISFFSHFHFNFYYVRCSLPAKLNSLRQKSKCFIISAAESVAQKWFRNILWKLFSWPKSRIKGASEGSLLQSNYSDHNSSLPVITPTAPIQHMDGYVRTQLACVWGNIIIIPSYNTMAFMHAPKNLNKTRMQFVRTKAIGPGQWGIQHNFEFYLNEMCE